MAKYNVYIQTARRTKNNIIADKVVLGTAKKTALRIAREFAAGKTETQNWRAYAFKGFLPSRLPQYSGERKGVVILISGRINPHHYRADGFFVDEEKNVVEVFVK